MKPIYKPNKKQTGASIKFELDKPNGIVYVQMAKQTGPMDDMPFKKSFADKTTNTRIKLSTLELAAISGGVENGKGLPKSLFHSFNSVTTGIVFEAGENAGTFKFALNTTYEDKTKCSVGAYLSSGESQLVRKYFDFCLNEIFFVEQLKEEGERREYFAKKSGTSAKKTEVDSNDVLGLGGGKKAAAVETEKTEDPPKTEKPVDEEAPF